MKVEYWFEEVPGSNILDNTTRVPRTVGTKEEALAAMQFKMELLVGSK